MKMKLARNLVVGLSAGMVLTILSGCTTVPETGRRQLNLFSPGQEMQLGLTAFNEVKSKTPINKDPAINAQVQRVGQRIAAVAPLPGAQWEFVVFENNEPNAFCLPGGKVGVHTGILPIAKDDAGLATVIGHEVAHAVARHGAERMSEALLMQTGSSLLGATLSSADPRTQVAVMTAYGLGAKLGRELPHSRAQESEADQLGLLYMARAGYDPEAAIGFWQRFAEHNRQHGGPQGLWFLRTHPLDEVRIQQLKEWLPRAKAEYEIHKPR